MSHSQSVIIRFFNQFDYLTCWQKMREFTHQRMDATLDEIWVLEHPPVFTQGQNGKPEHILNPGNIPVIQVDRGGQITYHGPGQLVAYTLIDIHRKKMNIRQFVTCLEEAVISLLKNYGILSHTIPKAPGVYVDQAKICSIGLRIRRGYAYHGLALNVAMNLEPFSRINPCGFSKLQMTQLSTLGTSENLSEVRLKLIDYLIEKLGYTSRLDIKGESNKAYESETTRC